MTTAHAKNRAPSAAKRWLSCPYSAFIAAMYPNAPTEASLKGDYWHELMEDRIRFGVLPMSVDPDASEAMDELAQYVIKRVAEMGGPGKVKIYLEHRLNIAETGEFGTGDILLVSDREIEIIDEKSGYVAVNIKMNAQLLLYLLGAITEFGERKKYRITLHQPNYDHIDGTLRSYDPTEEDIEWVRNEIRYSMQNEQLCTAGKHCKDTYCPHRGACEAFAMYVGTDLLKGWHTCEIRSTSDEYLAQALDASDELAGWRDALRTEAMRRIMNADRRIEGYKVVKGRKQRAVLDPVALVAAVSGTMGIEWAKRLFPDLIGFPGDLHAILSGVVTEPPNFYKNLGTPKHVEDVIKMYAKEHRMSPGDWKKVYENTVGPYIREIASGLTLEKAIDGRPAHRKGSEFGSLVVPSDTPVQII
jgi:hypothetical protein